MTNVGRDAEAHVLQVELDALQPFLHQQRAHLERRRPARREVLAQVRERETGVDDVLDDQRRARSVRSRSRSFMMRTTPLVRVADPYDDTAMKSNSTGRSIARDRSLMNTNAPLSTPTSSGGRPRSRR